MNNDKTVYIIFVGSYSDRHIFRVCSTRELAEKYSKYSGDSEIEEYKMDCILDEDTKYIVFKDSFGLFERHKTSDTVIKYACYSDLICDYDLDDSNEKINICNTVYDDGGTCIRINIIKAYEIKANDSVDEYLSKFKKYEQDIVAEKRYEYMDSKKN